jgi:hypothetical protein
MFAGLWSRDARLKESEGGLCDVFPGVWIVCEYFRRTWTPEFVEGSQCAVFPRPSLFWLHTSIPYELMKNKFCTTITTKSWPMKFVMIGLVSRWWTQVGQLWFFNYKKYCTYFFWLKKTCLCERWKVQLAFLY